MRSLLLAAILLLTRSAGAQIVWLEAENFTEPGGWVVDSQFMDQMGSPFVLAHGLGKPVPDATTVVKFPAAGKYRLWVRTRDWVAPWKAPGTPGRFEVHIDGAPVKTIFGTRGADWAWQDGGVVEIAGETARIALHDLTGFEGRCDALAFTTADAAAPPDGGEKLAALRRQMRGIPEKPEEAGEFDLVVVGGGIAGTCAAITASRLGLSVAFIQDRPVVGGNNSSEVRVWLQGQINLNPFPRVGDVVRELQQKKSAHYGPENKAELYEDQRRGDLVAGEPGIKVFMGHRANAVEMEGKRIVAVIAENVMTGKRLRFAGRLVADCTGDGSVGFLAGADHDVQETGHMGMSNLWNVIEKGVPSEFPRCPWAFNLSERPFPGRAEKDDAKAQKMLGGWYWEAGFNRDAIAEREIIRDTNFRAMYGAWDALKNVDRRFATYELNWAAFVGGNRESRRLLGDVILSKEDILKKKEWPDACFPATWDIDLHLPDKKYEKGFEGDAFISHATFGKYGGPYWVPYRCLYSRNIANLFMAGRDCSVTHEALGAVRVMRTGGMMGEVVGMAAYLAKQNGASPRGVYEKHLAELKELLGKGVGKLPPVVNKSQGRGGAAPKLNPPAWLKPEMPNLARAAAVSVSGSRDEIKNPPACLNDGKIDLSDNAGRWLGDGKPARIELAWEKEQTISAVRIVSGFSSGGIIAAPLEGFTIQQQQGGNWVDVIVVKANESYDRTVEFPAVKTARLRIAVDAVAGDIARVWEVEVYGAAGAARD